MTLLLNIIEPNELPQSKSKSSSTKSSESCNVSKKVTKKSIKKDFAKPRVSSSEQSKSQYKPKSNKFNSGTAKDSRTTSNKTKLTTLAAVKKLKLRSAENAATSTLNASATSASSDLIDNTDLIKESVFSCTKFGDLKFLNAIFLRNLAKESFDLLTTVQAKTIPEFMSGRNLFIRSQTGSGKTLAYAVPLVHLLQSIEPRLARSSGIRCLILVPTRELVLQTFETFTMLLKPFCNIVPGFVYGGANRTHEKARFRKGMNILIGTPGRLLDHILHTESCRLNRVRCLVFDEADRLLDMGFRKDIEKIVEILNKQFDSSLEDSTSSLGMVGGSKNVLEHQKLELETKRNQERQPKASKTQQFHPLVDVNANSRQTVLLSATLTKSVNELVDLSMKNGHLFIDAIDRDQLDKSKEEQTSTSSSSSQSLILPDCVQQNVVIVPVKIRLVTLFATILQKLYEHPDETCRIFVFMATCDMVEYHEKLFQLTFQRKICDRKKFNENEDDDDDLIFEAEPDLPEGIRFLKLHGSMNQQERKKVFSEFRSAAKAVLFCTDVAARGLDVPLADTIVHYTAPLTDEDYVHRTGRTGRIERPGQSILFLNDHEFDFANRLRARKVRIQTINVESLLISRNGSTDDTVLDTFYNQTKYSAASFNRTALDRIQERFERTVESDTNLSDLARLAYSSWMNFYRTYPFDMRKYFDFRKLHLGHFSSSFALKQTPKEIAAHQRNLRETNQMPLSLSCDLRAKYNAQLSNHEDELDEKAAKRGRKLENRIETVSNRKIMKRKASALANELRNSEYDSGLTDIDGDTIEAVPDVKKRRKISKFKA